MNKFTTAAREAVKKQLWLVNTLESSGETVRRCLDGETLLSKGLGMEIQLKRETLLSDATGGILCSKTTCQRVSPWSALEAVGTEVLHVNLTAESVIWQENLKHVGLMQAWAKLLKSGNMLQGHVPCKESLKGQFVKLGRWNPCWNGWHYRMLEREVRTIRCLLGKAAGMECSWPRKVTWSRGSRLPKAVVT